MGMISRLLAFVDDWRHRVSMRGFDDGTSWALDPYAPKERYYKPPKLFWRKAYTFQFWEGSLK